MDALYEWSLLIGRWVHIVTAIAWIGSSFFFNWLDALLLPCEDKSKASEGELWMVHSGGYYRVEKLPFDKQSMPKVLHWFKWEASWTYLSGLFLLFLIFYTGDGVYLLDSDVSSISYTKAKVLGLFFVFGSFFFYHSLWKSRWADKGLLAPLLTVFMIALSAYILCQFLSGRAAFLHLGAMMGTWMVLSVLMCIIPAQKKMIAQTQNNQEVDGRLAMKAKQRSILNNYMTMPVVFTMISHHFPFTYGSEHNWCILIFMCLAGALIRHSFNHKLRLSRHSKWALSGSLCFFVAILLWGQKNEMQPLPTEHIEEKIENTSSVLAIANEATITVRVSHAKEVGKPKALKVPPKCTKGLKGPLMDNSLLVKDGRVKNVLVRVVDYPAGSEPFRRKPSGNILDQKNCRYVPRVIAVQTKWPVVLKNSDAFFHNVKAKTVQNKGFNVAMPKKDDQITKIFERPELFVQTKCSVHPWMKAYIAVIDHPWFAITNQKGEAVIERAPMAPLTIEVWHEILGTKRLPIDLSSQRHIDLDIPL